MAIGLWLYSFIRFSFSKPGIISTDFILDGNLPASIDSRFLIENGGKDTITILIVWFVYLKKTLSMSQWYGIVTKLIF